VSLLGLTKTNNKKSNFNCSLQLLCVPLKMVITLNAMPIDIESLKIDCLRFFVCLLLAPAFQGQASSFLFFFVAVAFTVLIKQTRQAVCAVKQSIYS
jgi:hypothetical protein